MLDEARSHHYGDIVASWDKLGVFHERRRFLRAGFRFHRKRDYAASIVTLLPHLEGILAATFPPPPTMKKRRSMVTVMNEAVALTNTIMGELLVDAATVLWTDVPFETVKSDDRSLNRHLILHGRSTRFASEINSARVLFAFDLVASLVEDAERGPKATSKTITGA